MSDTIVQITEQVTVVTVLEDARVHVVTEGSEAVDVVTIGAQGPAGASFPHTVGAEPPANPGINHIWFDTSTT